jgi:signal transduction histidine kinase
VSDGAQPGQVDQWDGLFWRWEGIVVSSWLAGLVLVWATGETGVVGRLVASGLISMLAAWWFLLGRRLALTGADSWRGFAYLAVVLVLFAGAAVLVPDNSWMLIGLCPQAYMVCPRRTGLFWVVLLNAVPPLVDVVRHSTGTSFVIDVVIGVAIVVFAHFLGTSIDRLATESEKRAGLITELEASRAQVAALSRQAGVADERERLAGEIHDTLAQGFTSILTLVRAAEAALREDPDRAAGHLRLAATTARENLGEARALVGALTPAALGSGTLLDALRRQSERVAEECGIQVRFETSGDYGALAMPVEVVLLRAAQEALANVRRHSGADTACLRLDAEADVVRLAVVDDGGGFDAGTPGSGFGLRGMRARVEQIGGSVTVHSGPSGTSVRVEVPR